MRNAWRFVDDETQLQAMRDEQPPSDAAHRGAPRLPPRSMRRSASGSSSARSTIPPGMSATTLARVAVLGTSAHSPALPPGLDERGEGEVTR